MNSLALVPHETFPVPIVQPIADVAAYLKARRPVQFHAEEEALFITLWEHNQEDTKVLEQAVTYVQSLVNGGSKVQPACGRALQLFGHRWNAKTFRTLYDRWVKEKDWTVLVNRSKAPAAWRDGNVGLPESFIDYVAKRFAKFARRDGKRQALASIKRQWRTGRNHKGDVEVIEGYEAGWNTRNTEIEPAGWHYSNILRQIKARAKFTAPVRALLHEGTAAAKELLPQIAGSRGNLRFLEEVTFDDVRTDFLIVDPETGQACELWLLVARDSATAMVLGFVPHVSRAREDGSDSHLGLKEMKQLAGFILERYPLPPYICTWKVERGTATLSEGSRLALQELLPNRIRVSYTSMIGGKGATGYDEKKTGNSRGKASHESHNRLFHTQGSFIAGQTGACYDIRPADLKARCDEAAEIWTMAQRLPSHLRGEARYPLLTLKQACDHLFQFCIDQNFRTDHALEGFEQVLEWFDPSEGPQGRWKHQSLFVPGQVALPLKTRKRMEMPVERAIRLMAGHKWDRVSPHIIIAFYKHTIWPVKIKASGEILCRGVLYLPPTAGPRQPMEAVAYGHPDDPHFLYVTDGKGAVVGTWLRRDRVQRRDQEALAQAMRYTDAALKAVQAYAGDLAADERAQLAAMREHNARLGAGLGEGFIEVTDPQPATGEITSPVAAALGAIDEQIAEDRVQNKRNAEAAAEALLARQEREERGEPGAGDELLKALIGH